MNKLILITGATRGLGLAITTSLVDDGYTIIASGRSITKDLLALQKRYHNFLYFESFDLSHTDKIKTFVATITKKYGRIYGLVNNAALGYDGILATMHESQIAELMSVNIEAPILLSKYASRSMLMNQSGRIINISSIIADTGFNGLSVYGATKAAMIGFTKSLSRELGKAGVTVNCVSPGYMSTQMSQKLSGEKLQSILRRSPMKKLVTPTDAAYAVSFLMSEQADLITGTTITVDAGSTA